jgi:hypothetical protein
MKTLAITSHAGVTATVWQLDPGESPGGRHRHTVVHTTTVLTGSVRIEMWGADPHDFSRDATQPRIVLDANVDHKITAGTDGATILNMIADTAPVQAARGGVMLHDGTVA